MVGARSIRIRKVKGGNWWGVTYQRFEWWIKKDLAFWAFFLYKWRTTVKEGWGVWAWGFTIMNFHFFPFSLSCLPMHIFNKHNNPLMWYVKSLWSTLRNFFPFAISLCFTHSHSSSLSTLKPSHLCYISFVSVNGSYWSPQTSNYINNPVLTRIVEKIIRLHWYNGRVVR